MQNVHYYYLSADHHYYNMFSLSKVGKLYFHIQFKSHNIQILNNKCLISTFSRKTSWESQNLAASQQSGALWPPSVMYGEECNESFELLLKSIEKCLLATNFNFKVCKLSQAAIRFLRFVQSLSLIYTERSPACILMNVVDSVLEILSSSLQYLQQIEECWGCTSRILS